MNFSNSVPADAVLRLHVLVVVLRPAEEPQAHLAGEHGPPVRERGLVGALGGNSIEKNQFEFWLEKWLEIPFRVSHPIVREILSGFVLGVLLPCLGSS